MLLITTNPFNNGRETIASTGVEAVYNDSGRKYSQKEIEALLKYHNPEMIIAGTENYTTKQLDLCPNLKIIARVGIGLDSVDLRECSKRGIIVTYTPDAPSIAVAELTMSQIISALRDTPRVENNLKNRVWTRKIGREIFGSKVGIIGYGRIGTMVKMRMLPFNPNEILVNDILDLHIPITPKEDIYAECDIVTVHVPLNDTTKNLIDKHVFSYLKKNCVLANMSRGGIVNEQDAYEFFKENKDARFIIDTFEKEPYTGNLLDLDNVYVTPHLGSCSERSRYEMEQGATNEILQYIKKRENGTFYNRIV